MASTSFRRNTRTRRFSRRPRTSSCNACFGSRSFNSRTRRFTSRSRRSFSSGSRPNTSRSRRRWGTWNSRNWNWNQNTAWSGKSTSKRKAARKTAPRRKTRTFASSNRSFNRNKFAFSKAFRSYKRKAA